VIIISIIIYGFLAGIATGLGAVISVLLGKITKKVLSVSLGFASGIMWDFNLCPNSFQQTWAKPLCHADLTGRYSSLRARYSYPSPPNPYKRIAPYPKMGILLLLNCPAQSPEGIAIDFPTISHQMLS
jgi:ZIP family zinc transporter